MPVKVPGGVEVGPSVHCIVFCKESGYVELGADELEVAFEGGVYQTAAASPALGQVDVAVGLTKLTGGMVDGGWHWG